MERDQASKFVNDLLRLMVSRNGSDLFLTADFPPAIKVDGKVTKVSPQPLTGQHTLALTAAETGHLVFGTLHTSSAAKTIDRVVDVFPAAEKEMVRAMLSESLIGVISQTLCKTKDGSGRLAAHEIMLGTAAIRNLIREAKIADRKSTRLNSSHIQKSRMPSSA